LPRHNIENVDKESEQENISKRAVRASLALQIQGNEVEESLGQVLLGLFF